MSCIDAQLTALQQRVVNTLFHPTTVATAAMDVQASARLTAEQCLGIYRHSVQGVLSTHLQAVYPVCEQLLGEAFFAQTLTLFVDQQPPRSPLLADYGDTFPDFLVQQSALQSLPWLADVARVEWARHCAWHSAQLPAQDFRTFVQLSAPQQAQTRFYLPASAQLLASPFATHAVWLAHQVEDYPEKLALEAIHIAQPSLVLVWRLRRSLHQVLLSPLQWQFLSSVSSGMRLGQLVEQYKEALPALLMHGVQQGWLSHFGEYNEQVLD